MTRPDRKAREAETFQRWQALGTQVLVAREMNLTTNRIRQMCASHRRRVERLKRLEELLS